MTDIQQILVILTTHNAITICIDSIHIWHVKKVPIGEF